jgi:quinol monooxygenase YgiN
MTINFFTEKIPFDMRTMRRPFISLAKRHSALLLIITTMMMLTLENSFGQDSTYMRIAKITVDSTKLDDYIIALKTQMQSALRLEKGVLAYAAVQDKKNPSNITILETYASVDAYLAHAQTEHFKKYKTTVEGMVKQLELMDVVPIAIESKPK